MIVPSKHMSLSSYKNLELYFSEMARKGYLIKKINPVYFTFEEVESVDLDFSVVLFNETTEFDFPDNENETDFVSMAESSGWKKNASNKLMMIFSKPTSLDAININTDDEILFKYIKKAYYKNEFIIGVMFLVFMFLMRGVVTDINYLEITNNMFLMTLGIPIMYFTIVFRYIILRLSWIMINQNRIKNGKEIKFFSRRVSEFFSICSNLFLLLPLTMITFMELSIFGVGSLITLIPLVTTFLILVIFRKIVKIKKRPRWVNFLIYLGLIYLSLMLTTQFMMSPFALKHFGGDMLPEPEPVTITLSNGDSLDYVYDYKHSSSLLVPVTSSIHSKDIRIKKYSALNQRIADFIYDDIGIYRDYNNENIITELSKIDWNSDRAKKIIAKDSITIVLQRSKIVYQIYIKDKNIIVEQLQLIIDEYIDLLKTTSES